MEQAKKNKIKKILSVSVNVLMYVFLALCIFLLVVSVTSKKSSDGAMNIFGRQMRLVISNSMEKCDETYDDIKQYKIKDIPLHSMVFIELVPESEAEANAWYASLRVGDVLTFRYKDLTQETITHRIVSITPNSDGDGYTIVLEGDNRASGTAVGQQTIDTSDETSYNYVIGKVTGQSKVLGFLVYAVKQPVGIALIVIVPCLIIMVMEIIRIVSVLGEEKRRKAAEVQQQQSDEIEELRRQLASLQAGLAGSPAPPEQPQPTAVDGQTADVGQAEAVQTESVQSVTTESVPAQAEAAEQTAQAPAATEQTVEQTANTDSAAVQAEQAEQPNEQDQAEK